MSGIATAIVGTAVVGDIINSNATNKAISAQQQATNQADQTQMAMFDQEQANAAPWLAAGSQALGSAQALMANPSSYLQSPSYQFNLTNGLDALSRQTANRGGMLAGSALGGAESYAQGMASNGYQQALSNYMQMAGMGQTAVGQTNSAGMNASNIVSGNLMNLGAGTSAADIAQGNNLTGMMNTGVNQYMNYNLMSQLSGQNGLAAINGQLNGMNPSYNGTSVASGPAPSIG